MSDPSPNDHVVVRDSAAPGSVCSSCAIRRVEWYHDFQLRSSVGSTVKVNRSTQSRDPLTHARRVPYGRRVQPLRAQVRRASPVIAHSELHYFTANAYGYIHRTGTGVPQHVGKAFLQGSEQRKLCLLGQRRHNGRCVQLDAYAAALGEVCDEGAQGRQKPEIVPAKA